MNIASMVEILLREREREREREIREELEPEVLGMCPTFA
jgi:hypothetical protein